MHQSVRHLSVHNPSVHNHSVHTKYEDDTTGLNSSCRCSACSSIALFPLKGMLFVSCMLVPGKGWDMAKTGI